MRRVDFADTWILTRHQALSLSPECVVRQAQLLRSRFGLQAAAMVEHKSASLAGALGQTRPARPAPASRRERAARRMRGCVRGAQSPRRRMGNVNVRGRGAGASEPLGRRS